jgi:hypothetical protein
LLDREVLQFWVTRFVHTPLSISKQGVVCMSRISRKGHRFMIGM